MQLTPHHPAAFQYPCSSRPAASASDRAAAPATHATFAFAPSRVSAARPEPGGGGGGGPEQKPVDGASLVHLYGRAGGATQTADRPAGGGLLDQMNQWSGAGAAAAAEVSSGLPAATRAERASQSAPAPATAAGRGRQPSKFRLSHNPAALVLGGCRVPDSSTVLGSDGPPPVSAGGRGRTSAGNTPATSSGTAATASTATPATTSSATPANAAPEQDAKKKSKIADYIIGVSCLFTWTG